MSHPSPAARRQRGFTFLEVLLVLGIIALMIACVAGYFLSLRVEPLVARPIPPAVATPVPAPTPAVEKKPAPAP